MSNHIFGQLTALPPEKIAGLRHHFRDAPKATKLIDFMLANKNGNFSIRQAVQYVYAAKAGSPKYKLFENCYYKLRKKIADHLNAHDIPAGEMFTREEKALLQAKALIAGGKFAEAENILLVTEATCRRQNIFELLPEITDQLIQARQSLNKLDENKELHKKFHETLTLYADLMEAKNLVRQVYEVNFRKGIKAAAPLFRRMAKLDRKHKNYPRFKLIYNFVAGYYKVGAGDSQYQDKSNVTNRHIGMAKKLMLQYPDMPAIHYTSTGQVTQRYRLLELQAMCYFNALRFTDAADEILRLYSAVLQPGSPMNRMKNEILFTNVMHMLVAANRFKEALQVARDYLKFLLANKRHAQAGYAYAEIANIHVSMFPQSSGYDPLFLLKKVNEYLASQKKVNDVYFSRPIYLMKIRLYLTMGKYPEAERMLKSPVVNQLKDEHDFFPALHELVVIKKMEDGELKKRKMQSLKGESRKMKLRATTPGKYLNWAWMEKIVEAT